MNIDLSDLFSLIAQIIAAITTLWGFTITVSRHGKIIKFAITFAREKTHLTIRADSESIEKMLKLGEALAAFNLVKYISLFLTKNGTQKNKNVTPSIVGLLAIKRSRRNLAISGLLLTTLVVHESISYFENNSLLNWPAILLIILIVAIAVDEHILSYRLQKGYFGTNKEEAREIINFILKNADTNDNFNGPDGKLRIFDEIINESTQLGNDYDLGLNPAIN